MRGKGRAHTFDLFSTAIQYSQAGEFPLLLLDSEGPVAPQNTVWQHLKARDGWEKPKEAKDDHAYLMAQVMETWILADISALRAYFGSSFKPDKIPDWTDLESVPKLKIFQALSKATAACGEKQYAKGKISFELLGKLNPELVREKCPQAKLLLDFLTK